MGNREIGKLVRVSVAAWLVSLCLLGASAASAQDASVVVLGLRSIEGDDDVAATVTEALRAAASTVEGWQVQSRGPTMAQMSMAHGCDEMDARCLVDIAEGLSVQHVVYGTVRRTSTREEYDYVLSLSLFDAAAGSIENSLSETVTRDAVNGGTVSARAADLIAGLTGQETSQELGSVRVTLNVATDAHFYVDGQDAGQSRSGGFAQEGVAAGTHTLQVEAEGYHDFETTFEVVAGAPATVSVNLLPTQPAEGPPAAFDTQFTSDMPTDVQGDAWLGYSLLGVSALSLFGTAVSWTVINNINENPQFRAYSNRVYLGNERREAGIAPVTDVCEEALVNGSPYSTDLGDIQDMCRDGRTFEVLQWVFLGMAAISGGVGTYVLVDGVDTFGSSSTGPSLALRPRVGLNSAHVDAQLRF